MTILTTNIFIILIPSYSVNYFHLYIKKAPYSYRLLCGRQQLDVYKNECGNAIMKLFLLTDKLLIYK